MNGGTFVFAGGGTGGHIYPGLAIAREIEALDPAARCLFVVSNRPLDARILTEHGREHVIIPARPIGLRPRAAIRFLRSWGPSVRQSRGILRSAKAPVHVVAMGGFVAAPVVQAARVERAPITLVNLDAVPGKANRWIARHAREVITSAPVNAQFARDWHSVPPIVRREAATGLSRSECRRRLGLDENAPTLLVTGGSQGAQSINDLMAALAAQGFPAGWQVLHQCGRDAEGALVEAYRAAGVRAIVEPFVPGMGLWWGSADLAVSRSGAGSVAEAWANTVPAVFLPYPYHRDQHQKANAAALEAAGAAEIHPDRIAPHVNMELAGKAIIRLMNDSAARGEMNAALARLGPADGALQVARHLVADSRP